MEDKLLKNRIKVLVDKIPRMNRQDAREELYDLVKEYQLAETKDGMLTNYDLNRIHDAAVGQIQNLSLPFYVDGKEVDTPQRNAYCYLMAVVGYLRSIGVLNRSIDVNKEVPIVDPTED